MKDRKIIKATFIIMIISVFSRALGMIRDLLVGNIFGVSAYTDAYKAAVIIPDTVFAIIGLGISTIFIPMLSKIKYEKDNEEMYSFANNVVTILSILSIVFIVLGFIYTKDLVRLFARGFDEKTLNIAILLTRISLINLLFLSVNACYTAMLQVCEDFIIPSILGVFFNAPIILYLMFFKSVNVYGLTIANVLGNILRVIVQLPSLYNHGYKFKLQFKLNDNRIKRIFSLLIPVMIGAGANSLNLVVDTNIASTLGSGTMSVLDYAQKIILFTNTAITTSIVSVMYPVMTNRLNEGDNEGFIKYLNKSMVYIIFLLVPIAMGFMLLSNEIIHVFYGWGKRFTPENIVLTALALLGYSLSIPFIGIRDILNASLFSMEKTKETAINGIVGVIVNIVLSISLVKVFGVFGISVASSISAFITAILLFKSTRKVMGNFDISQIMGKFLKIICASIIMIIMLKIFNRVSVLSHILIRGRCIINIALNAIVGAIIYIITCKAFKLEEMNELINIIKIKK